MTELQRPIRGFQAVQHRDLLKYKKKIKQDRNNIVEIMAKYFPGVKSRTFSDI